MSTAQRDREWHAKRECRGAMGAAAILGITQVTKAIATPSLSDAYIRSNMGLDRTDGWRNENEDCLEVAQLVPSYGVPVPLKRPGGLFLLLPLPLLLLLLVVVGAFPVEAAEEPLRCALRSEHWALRNPHAFVEFLHIPVNVAHPGVPSLPMKGNGFSHRNIITRLELIDNGMCNLFGCRLDAPTVEK
jgi:hypothetical protein